MITWLRQHPLVWILPLALTAIAAFYIGRLARAEATTGDSAIDYQI